MTDPANIFNIFAGKFSVYRTNVFSTKNHSLHAVCSSLLFLVRANSLGSEAVKVFSCTRSPRVS